MSTAEHEEQLDRIVRARLDQSRAQITHSLKQIAAGNPLGSEPNVERRTARLARKTGFDIRQAEALSTSIGVTARQVDRTRPKAEGPEAVWGTADFLGVEFFARGRRAANAVGRISFESGRAQGTGFLVGPNLLLTNNHVITTQADAESMVVQFDFEADENGLDRISTVFTFDPSRCFALSPIDGLDFTLIALGDRQSGGKRLEDFGYLTLSDASDKHMLGEFANLIQHPEGRPKQIVLRNNNLVARDETTHVLHYTADTQPGSSGSPVLNNEWEPIALHHWAGPHLETRSVSGRKLEIEVNEGIRISAIVKSLRQGAGTRDTQTRRTVTELVKLWDSPRTPTRSATRSIRENASEIPAGSASRMNADGTISWIFPIEINVRAPLASTASLPAAPATVEDAVAKTLRGGEKNEDENLSDRGGYEPGFIPGYVVPLPDYSKVGYRIAKNQQATGSDDEHELRYSHFSIVMNADRRLAAFTACNIDGARIKAINRQTKDVTDNPTLAQLDAESFSPGAESSDAFRPDPRVLDEEQMAREFYDEQKVPGYDKPKYPAKNASDATKKAYYRAMAERTARMLQKGHIVLRGDPAWGTHEEALLSESDTFHYTNAAPQLGFFNQGSRDDHPGEKGKLRWRTVETYVLRNAVTTRQRICVFAGPVFRDDDPEYRMGTQLPLKFWKIAVWADAGKLHSVAVIADQGEVLEKLTQGVPEAIAPQHGREAFDDSDELARVSQFLTTVAEIERLTGLDFGDDVRDGDIRRGEAATADVDSLDGMTPRRTTRGKQAAKKKVPRKKAAKRRARRK